MFPISSVIILETHWYLQISCKEENRVVFFFQIIRILKKKKKLKLVTYNSWLKAPKGALNLFLELKHISCFWSGNHWLLLHFFLKNHYFSGRLRRFLSQTFFDSFSQREIALKFSKYAIKFFLITLGLLEAFWHHFWTLSIFHVFGTEIIVFWNNFFENIIKFVGGEGRRHISVQKFLSYFRGEIKLKFPNFEN